MKTKFRVRHLSESWHDGEDDELIILGTEVCSDILISSVRDLSPDLIILIEQLIRQIVPLLCSLVQRTDSEPMKCGAK